jgi:DNA-binding IclR family transcriptional regulator
MPVKSAARVVDIIETVAESGDGISISDLARRLAIPKSSAWTVGTTLVERAFLERTRDGRLVLGDRLFDVVRSARLDRSLKSAAHPLMTELMEKTGESVFLGVLTPEFEVLLIHKVLGPQVIRYDADVGQTIPAYCTASGRVLLAHLPPVSLARFLRSTRRRLTVRTVTQRRRLLKELENARRNGVAFNFGERVAGASGISAPLYSGSGRVIAELGLAGPTPRLLARHKELGRLVKATALRISAALGYRAEPTAGDGGTDEPGAVPPTRRPGSSARGQDSVGPPGPGRPGKAAGGWRPARPRRRSGEV